MGKINVWGFFFLFKGAAKLLAHLVSILFIKLGV